MAAAAPSGWSHVHLRIRPKFIAINILMIPFTKRKDSIVAASVTKCVGTMYGTYGKKKIRIELIVVFDEE